jgi:RimJ/RimL family protein N-acetyltransferase
MKDNQSVCLVTEHLLLVPYQRAHLSRYHEWMQDPFLLEMTATEPMSVAEEEAAQRDWIEDARKLTFIIFDRRAAEAAPSDCTAGMCGDTNLFLLDDEGDDMRAPSAEVMVMIAEPAYRRRGYGREAVLALMGYASNALGTAAFVAKISAGNEPSLGLFESKLGYSRFKLVPAFDEVHLSRTTGQDLEAELRAVGFEVRPFDNPEAEAA